MTQQSIAVHIVAGFLGAGKTTFINKLFADGVDAASTVLIENELGDTAIDDELVQVGDLEVRTLTSGCVCCSLRGDLADTIEMVVEKLSPKTILIEPTGVASPNELIRICANDLWNLPLNVESVITIVNAQSIEEMLDLDIGVFEAQLTQARLAVFSRTQFMTRAQIDHACKLLREFVDWNIPVLDAPWDDVDALEVLELAKEAFGQAPSLSGAGSARALEDDAHDDEHEHEHGHEHGHHHEHHHEHGHDHGHVHYAGGMTSYVIYPEEVFDQAALQALGNQLESGTHGQVLRAKGFVRSAEGGMVHVEYVYGSMQLSPIDYDGAPKLVIIGRNLAI